ncbi:MAG: aminopeptidase [Lachnospiraceae bacterium]|nr:aminopeptidase [Lachnospiraceae bacterium]
METKNIWENYSQKQLRELEVFCKDYRDFLDNAKTEREAVNVIVNLAEKSGYVELEEVIKAGKKLKAGDKIYAVNMNKAIMLFNIGKEPLEKGMNILGAHIDSPRMDVKSNPLYEDSSIAYLDTHYYGGIKKYQWVATPLSLHGVVVKKDGSTIEMAIGDDEDDPVFFVSDLLIHLAAEQLDKKAAKVVEGEALDIIVGNRPLVIKDSKDKKKEEKKKDPVKEGVLKILKDDYGMEEEDFLSAELEVVPAGKAREAGFDRSMILAYGQDDRVCAFSSLFAMLQVKDVERTSCCILVDKEEIGSVGATGMTSVYFENVIRELMNLEGKYDEIKVRRCLSASTMLSSDVNAAFDPSYASAFEKKNASFMGAGMVFSKFTGSRGKSGSNDANAEYIAYLRKVLDDAKVAYQFAELGKVDVGGGGTIAYIMAKYGMNVIDAGVAVLNMHAPYEATSKADVYETMRGYIAFLNAAGM